MAVKTCTCGHVKANHKEVAVVGRRNSPVSVHACSQCDCWTFKEEQR